MKKIRLSVHDIVDFVYSEGDIIPAMAQKNNMRDGTIIHQIVQKKMGLDSEVFVKVERIIDDYEIELQGRIDLLEKVEDKYHIIEIKSTHTFESLTEETHLAHFAQAKFYGLMLYHHYQLDRTKEIKISVLYINKYTYAEKYFTKVYHYQEIETFFDEVMRKYLSFRIIIDDFHDLKIETIKTLNFPYNQYRIGQQELIENVETAIIENNSLFVCAPTGIGKSLGTLYPAVKSIDNKETRIFYLTAKSMIKDIARSSLNLMRQNSSLRIKSVTITAKDKICINDCVKCNPKDCPFARNFFGKVNDAVIDMFQTEDDFYYENIISYAKKYEICPFEFQLTMALYSDVIICDYNYVFDIRVYLRRFFDFDTKAFMLLIDEAHNMYDRVCNMYTASVNYAILDDISENCDNNRDISNVTQSLYGKLKQYENHLISNQKFNMKFFDIDEVILNQVESLLSKIEKYFDKQREQEIELNETLLNRYFDLNNFFKISEFYNDDFMIWVSSSKDNLDYQITCLNPRDLIKMRTDNVRATIFFSATLHPIEYHMSLLGGNELSKQLILPSPFKQENLTLVVNPYISTKYNKRDDTKYQIAYQIEKLISNGGKYMVYFSSYQYLELIYNVFNKINEYDFEIIKQSRDMTETNRNEFINRFDESQKNIIGFAVLGGVFAEGIDLKGEKLNGVIIIGVGLPMFDDFRSELKNYFDQVYHKGYQYAYMYPGFNKVLQAVGRVIRDENDKGIALLIDDRYLNYEYLKLFPNHWSHYQKIGW